MPLDDIRTKLCTAKAVPVDALRAAVAHADALADDVYALADKFCRGVYLFPAQDKLLFHGLHVLGAARHVGLYPCLVSLLRHNKNDLDHLFPDHGSASMTRLMLSVWDGDADALFHMIEFADLAESAKWALFDVLARLTFDGRIPRARTAKFLERFESAPLTDEDDNSWWAWEDAVTRLGLIELEPALRRVWAKPTNEHRRRIDNDECLAELLHTAANPSDPEPFVADKIMAIEDPAEALAWVTLQSEFRAQVRRERAAESGPPPEDSDPAKAIRLTPDEQFWLEGFLYSDQAPETTLSFEALDGFFTALVIGPAMVPPSEYLPEIWGTPDGKGPEWDSLEQAEYVLALLMRHWNAIVARRMAGVPFPSAMEVHADDAVRGFDWVNGFEAGIALREDAWSPLFENRRGAELVWAVLDLAAPTGLQNAKPISTLRRKQILDQLPTLLQRISDYWKDPRAALPAAQPVRSIKVGRNDPCPCGSGKKYKKCCGGAGTVH
jgi:uncharacterized protein